ncbi:MAG: aldo/keto reductase [Spirochaetia bacterium]
MYEAKDTRYDDMVYRPSGQFGVKLPIISLGLWQNFGHINQLSHMSTLLRFAFDQGITHFDLANNYGPPPGAAEENFGILLKKDFACYRDELMISTKAGHPMWPGPYGNWGSKKYLIASLDQSLSRMGLDYVDIFYHHRPDPDTPLWETAEALISIIQQGKALYIGLSNYPLKETIQMTDLIEKQGYRILIHQPKYNMFERWIEDGLTEFLDKKGIGCIAYSPLAQGLLSDKYIHGIPEDSRYGLRLKNKEIETLPFDKIQIAKVEKLGVLAKERGQSLSQMALSWALLRGNLTSVLVGVSRIEQLVNNLKILDNLAFSEQELATIDTILKG